jgi:hypothetical protein
MNNRIPLKQRVHESSLKTQAESAIRIIKFLAPKIMTVNGHSSPCECTDIMTCAYCVQASLLGFEEKIKVNDDVTSNILSSIKRHGIRRTARDLKIDHSTVKYWLKSRNIPQWVFKKYAKVGE